MIPAGYKLISRFSTTLVFPVEDLGAPPRPRIWHPRPIREQPNFSKAPLRGAGILFSRGRAKKARPYAKKMGSTPGSNPGSGSFGNIFDLFFSNSHRLVKLRPEIKHMLCISYGLRTAAKRVYETPSFSAAEIAVFQSGRINGRWHQSSVENRF